MHTERNSKRQPNRWHPTNNTFSDSCARNAFNMPDYAIQFNLYGIQCIRIEDHISTLCITKHE